MLKSAPAFFMLMALLLLAPGRAAAGPPPAGEETRAIWVVRHALTTPGRVDKIVDLSTQVNANTLLVQVRGRGDAYYTSDLAPRAADLEATAADFDPLARLCAKAHAAGLEVHAWINVYLVWSAGAPPRPALHVVNAHPDWISVRADGRRLAEMLPEEFKEEKFEGMYLAPGNPDVRRHIRELVRELVARYPVDGIHLDYVRYPDPTVGYDPHTRTAFEREFGVDPIRLEQPDSAFLDLLGGADRIADLRTRWIEWKREQVTNLVRDLRHDLDLSGRKIKLTAAVIADQNAALNRYLQDWPAWLREDLLDAAIPMTYSPSTPIVERQIAAAMNLPTKRQIWAGIAVYNQGARDACDKIRKARALGVDGIALFSYDALLGRSGYARSVRSWAWREPTEPTRMAWREGR
ncbi:MAG: family 10 glycosylhydrolase [Candidatus Eisenbacteria bacterium]